MKFIGIGVAMVVAGLTCGVTGAADSASDADREFVGKVSQGGLYEVEAGKIAAMRGTVPAVKNFGALDAHDHVGVNSQLKSIAKATNVSIAPGLNAEFSERLSKLKGKSASEFDAYYIDDMKQIHNKDEGLFVKEAEEGSPSYKEFAHNTAVLVKAHLGWLNAL